MKTFSITRGCLVVGAILGFSATQPDINFIASDWILLPGWSTNYQRGKLIEELNGLMDRISEIELASKHK